MIWGDTLINGALLGGLYGLLGLGLALVFGVMRVVNIAHGEFMVLSAFCAVLLSNLFPQVSPLLMLIPVIVLSFAVGRLYQAAIVNRVVTSPDPLSPLLLSFGVSVILRNVMVELFGADVRSLQVGELSRASLEIGGLNMGMMPLITLVLAALLFMAMQLVLRHTEFGRIVRATADRRDIVRLSGVKPDRVYNYVMGLSLALGAIRRVHHQGPRGLGGKGACRTRRRGAKPVERAAVPHSQARRDHRDHRTQAEGQPQRSRRSDLQGHRLQGVLGSCIWGICPGRFSKRNRLTTKGIEELLARLAPFEGPVSENQRREFGEHYRELSAAQKPVPPPQAIVAAYAPASDDRQEVIMLGSAGQRIITAGEILCLAGLHAGLNVTQKNDYDITVLRGPSISEMILSPQAIDYTGIQRPSVVSALGPEGVARRKKIFADLDDHSTVIQAVGVERPGQPGPYPSGRL